MGRRGPVHAAPYGQACLHCFKSKSKCVSQGDGAGCERCHRLNKECCPSDAFRRRHTKKGDKDAARFAQLEGRVDALVSLLQSSPALREALGNGYVEQEHREAEADGLNDLYSLEPVDPAEEWTEGTYDDASPIHLQTPFSQSPNHDAEPTPTHTPGSLWDITAEEAEAHMAMFRDKMLRFFAFLYLPPELNAHQLRQEQPLLFRAILTVTASSTQQRLLRGRELKQLIAQAAFVETQAHMDLLLCVLTYVVWGYDQFFNKVASSSRLTQLAMSLVGALHLHKSLPRAAHSVPGEVHEIPIPHPTNAETSQLTLERGRAVLGCFLLSSIVSSYFGDMDAMRWTARMEGYLRDIEGTTPCPTDKMLALQVRMQRLVQRAVEMRDQQEADPCQSSPMLTSLYVKTLQAQLQDIRASIPPELEQEAKTVLPIFYSPTEPCPEPIPSARPNLPAGCSHPASGPFTAGLDRLECHWRSVEAIKSWLDVFFSLSPAAYVGLSFPFWAQMVRCITVLYRLSIYVDPLWDRLAVRRGVDLLPVLDHIAEVMQHTGAEAGEQSPHDLFSQIARIASRFQAWAAVRLEPDPPLQPVSVSGPSPAAPVDTTVPWLDAGSVGGEMAVDDSQMLMQYFDGGNDAWIGEFLRGF
ncbi:hypothetical protein BDV10DRAFT_186149 [Aspergillus recurvatus]